MKLLMTINDAVWIVTAILCIFFDNSIITAIVIITTIIYAVDLFVKLKNLNWNFKEFFKSYWLDVLFLIPVCKLFRGFRIIKVGKLLRALDAGSDFTEIFFRLFNFIKRKHGHKKLNNEQW